jgi:phage-related holin
MGLITDESIKSPIDIARGVFSALLILLVILSLVELVLGLLKYTRYKNIDKYRRIAIFRIKRGLYTFIVLIMIWFFIIYLEAHF